MTPDRDTEPSPPPAEPPIDQPACTLCGHVLPDPDAGTDHSGVYDVMCDGCGAWVELDRVAVVAFVVLTACPSVPPHVFLGTPGGEDPDPD